ATARRMAGRRCRQELQDRQRGDGFAGAGFANERQRLALVERERCAFYRRERAFGQGKIHAEIFDFEEGHQPPFRGSKASRTASPTKISRLSIKARTKNAVKPSQGACKLPLPSASNSPSEGEPGGKPNPRKSSEVSVVIEPFRMNGKKVSVATMALGSTWRQM